MRILKDLNELPTFQNAIITIGSFDGVHCGHQRIIEQVNALARKIGGESVVITFHPHPRQVIYPQDDTLKLLTTTEEKIFLLEKYGVDNVVIVPFTIEFSQISADEYIEKFLVEKFHPHSIVIGYDHRFGLNRQGDINYLRWYASKSNFEVIEIEQQEVDDIAVSSTKIRKALEDGRVSVGRKLLGHYYTLSGTVVHGQKIGASLGFPTANIEIVQSEKLIPPDGIYAVQVTHDGQRYGGMLYIGSRPTLKKYNNRTIEVNIFNFNQTIYGDELKLELVDFIRYDTKFDDLEGLKKQLAEDRKRAQLLLASLEQTPRADVNIAVVILNYNGQRYLAQFLPSVLKNSSEAEVIVADNGSTDDSIAFLQKYYPDVRRIEIKENLGFAAGYNQALKQLSKEWDYFVLLNSDVEVTPDWLKPLIATLEKDATIAAAQPKIKADGQRDHFEYAGAAGGWIDALGYPFCRGRIFAVTEKDNGQYDKAQEIFWASGAALAIRAKLFQEIGGFDGDYFAHLEEIDLCWRLKRAGYKIIAEPTSVVYHVGGGTLSYNTPFKTYLNFRNSLYTLVKNESAGKLLWLLPLRLILDGLAAILFLTEGKFQHIRSIIKAHWTFFPHFGKSWHKRKTTQQRIDAVRIGKENTHGRLKGSIVWRYYALGKKHFSDIVGGSEIQAGK
ncbi:MAG: bifunctional riboflavin kinase/FAD synthetase [Saprospiraceae bacterium]|nr:bifunctional riboflavin kinase/FAD synthetase [Saprospiraceae bacterium]